MKNLELVIFDMDGTLVDSAIDFPLLKSEIGLSANADTLLELSNLKDNEVIGRWNEIIHRHELEGAKRATVFPGVLDLLVKLKNDGRKIAIMTRNSREITDITLEKIEFDFDYILTRDELSNHKPNPEGLIFLCNHFRIEPMNAIYIGDYYIDVLAANNAKMSSAFFMRDRNDIDHSNPDFIFNNFLELEKFLF
jgi:HAD superfamily hydrolase (TIGR01549 family)